MSDTPKLRRVLVGGAGGFVGSALLPYLKEEGFEVWRLIRSESCDPGHREILWNPKKLTIQEHGLEGFEAIINLAGENIAGRWTKRKKKAIYESRVLGTKLISAAIAKLASPPKVFISASAIGFYGNRPGEVLDETSSMGAGFLAETVRDWEAATAPVKSSGIRVVHLRIGLVLHISGGALQKMLLPFQLGLGGRLGDGTQDLSWIALSDLIRSIGFIIKNDSLSGPINATSPNVVTNGEFTKILGAAVQRPTICAIPKVVLLVLFGQMAKETLLSGAHVLPKKLLDAGFQYRLSDLKKALLASFSDNA